MKELYLQLLAWIIISFFYILKRILKRVKIEYTVATNKNSRRFCKGIAKRWQIRDWACNSKHSRAIHRCILYYRHQRHNPAAAAR
jgi:hypothetical protein